jgi:hypothetical protein
VPDHAVRFKLDENLALHDPAGSLWVLTPGRFRIYPAAAED